MGLDLVELIMGIEEAIGVSIPDDVGAFLTTPRELIDYLHSQLPQSPSQACLSQRAFHVLRHVCGEKFHLPRGALRPKASWFLCSHKITLVRPGKRWAGCWAFPGGHEFGARDGLPTSSTLRDRAHSARLRLIWRAVPHGPSSLQMRVGPGGRCMRSLRGNLTSDWASVSFRWMIALARIWESIRENSDP